MPGQHTSLEARIVNKWTYIVTTQVGLQLPRKNFESRTLPDTVSSDETEHLARTWCGETVKLERVRGIPMCYFSIEVCGKVDDCNGLEWTPWDVWSPRNVRRTKRGVRTSSRKYHNQYTRTLR